MSQGGCGVPWGVGVLVGSTSAFYPALELWLNFLTGSSALPHARPGQALPMFRTICHLLGTMRERCPPSQNPPVAGRVAAPQKMPRADSPGPEGVP